MKLRRLVVLVTGAVLLTIAAIVWVHRAADASWAQMAAWASRAEAQWAERDFTRLPITGDASAGSAFAAYAEAVDLATALRQDDQALLRDLRLKPEVVSALDAEAFALRWQPPLAALQRGAHRTDARPPVRWEDGFSKPGMVLLPMRDLANAATIEVRRLLARSADTAAVDLSLDCATYAVDALHSPRLVDQMIGAAILAIATGETWREQDLQQLGPDALARLASGLVHLDARCPTAPNQDGEILLLAHTLMHPSLRDALFDDMSMSFSDWRYGWSARWVVADAVLQQVAAHARLATLGGPKWSVRQAHLLSAVEDPLVQANPLLRATTVSWAAAEQTLRSAVTMVRLLRLAVACHAGGDLPALQDPLGDGPLQVTHTAANVALQSVGSARSNRFERLVAR